ncbi:hypothetical protein BTZ20_0036 [Rhodococcus sp. MTM3W5.2]|uniref:hypothetical protein n=1 Tax=Rhodococcus sp. MTM3W5.2 TaxID=1805827 RepID=UPI00097935A3|nr:hypothetical protein [Rhodococcus sp. MTM3W5.2]AQA22098.1 hypothetical protein BTZ20_0036 [Rhodococcus sp. MTM3W5.2]
MGLVEYSFGTGEGAPRDWVSEADLDLGGTGAADAVSLDFDGDGLLDDAMWDSDGDGDADRSVLDVGDEGRYFEDASGAGSGTSRSRRRPPRPGTSCAGRTRGAWTEGCRVARARDRWRSTSTSTAHPTSR